MDKFEHRRQCLQHLVNSMGRGAISKIANDIGKSPDYVSRMLYPTTKRGFKRIGEDSVELITKAYPGWMDDKINSIVGKASERKSLSPAAGAGKAIPAMEGMVQYHVVGASDPTPAWPFKTISAHEWQRIPATIRHSLEQQIRGVIPTNKLAIEQHEQQPQLKTGSK